MSKNKKTKAASPKKATINVRKKTNNSAVSKKYLKLIVFAVILIAGAGAAYFFVNRSAGFGQYSSQFKAGGSPVEIKTKLDPKKVSRLITDEKGSDISQGDFTLEIPEDALAGRENITVNKIASISGLPEGWKFIDGYDFEPDGTTFAKPATATLAKLPSKNVHAFKISEGRLTRIPLLKTDEGHTAYLNSFSGVAFIEISGDVPSVANPNEIELKAREIVSNIVAENQETVNDEKISRIKNVLGVWYRTSVKKHLSEAVKNDKTLKDSIGEYITWLSYVQIFGLDDDFADEIAEGKKLIAQGLANAVQIASNKCVNETDVTQAASMLTWQIFSQMLGMDDQAGLDNDEIEQKIKNCTRFELAIESRMDTSTSVGDSFVTLKGSADISLNDDGQFVGKGTVTEGPWTQIGTCEYSVGKSTHNIRIGETAFNPVLGSKPGVNINLLLDLTEMLDYDATYTCSRLNVTVGHPGTQWESDFDSIHQKDAGAAFANSDCACYIISDWEYVGAGGVVAKKTLKGTDSTWGVATSGTTKFTLYHRPKN